MNKDRIYSVLNDVKKKLEGLGYNVAYVCLYGSQNYNLDLNTEEYISDIDTKAFIIPTLEQLVANSKPVSTILQSTDGEGQIDVKDIRIFTETLMKGNPTYIEALYAKYYIFGDDLTKAFMTELINHREELVRALEPNIIKALYGMACEKEKALCHPFPSIVEKIEKYGYDGKQLSHIIRLYYLMWDYFGGIKSYEDALWFQDDDYRREEILYIKKNEPTLEEAKVTCSYYMDLFKKNKGIFSEKIIEKINNGEYDFSIKQDMVNLINSMVAEFIRNTLI